MFSETTKLGTELSKEDQRHVLAAFVHRFTGDNHPAWARKPRPDGTAYPLQFASDVEWLANTRFEVFNGGELNVHFSHCESSPTWPNNPELR
jgi:hypothetical protein